MKIYYDEVSSEYRYPLSKGDVAKAKRIVSPEVIGRIRAVKFGCNVATTQEGRTVQKGGRFDIRVNFCLKNNTSLLLSDNRDYVNQIKGFGGSVDIKSRRVTWELQDARTYCFFLLFHEMGHVAYSGEYFDGAITGPPSNKEEQWCDNYAMQKIKDLR